MRYISRYLWVEDLSYTDLKCTQFLLRMEDFYKTVCINIINDLMLPRVILSFKTGYSKLSYALVTLLTALICVRMLLRLDD